MIPSSIIAGSHQNEQVPPPTGAPLYEAAPQATQAIFAFHDAGHDDGGHGRAHKRLQDVQEEKVGFQDPPHREHIRHQDNPCEGVRHEKEEEQGCRRILSRRLAGADTG
jgi:hypothetical protein